MLYCPMEHAMQVMTTIRMMVYIKVNFDSSLEKYPFPVTKTSLSVVHSVNKKMILHGFCKVNMDAGKAKKSRNDKILHAWPGASDGRYAGEARRDAVCAKISR